MAAKNSSWVEDLFTGLAIIGGGWLFITLVEAFSKVKEFYSCPICNADIVYKENPCHNCKNDLIWPKDMKENERLHGRA